VQKPITLPDGSVIRLTTARYYTPTGRSIQKPYEDGVEQYMKEVSSRYSNGEVFHMDSIHFPDSLKYATPNGRTVFGGGGIMPDIFLPVDTTKYSEYYGLLVRRGIFNAYTLDYVNKQRKELMAKYPNVESFENSFPVSAAMLKEFTDYAAGKEIHYSEDGFNKSKGEIELYLKALVARNLYDVNAYYRIILSDDDEVKKALDIFENPREFRKYLVVK